MTATLTVSGSEKGSSEGVLSCCQGTCQCRLAGLVDYPENTSSILCKWKINLLLIKGLDLWKTYHQISRRFMYFLCKIFSVNALFVERPQEKDVITKITVLSLFSLNYNRVL